VQGNPVVLTEGEKNKFINPEEERGFALNCVHVGFAPRQNLMGDHRVVAFIIDREGVDDGGTSNDECDQQDHETKKDDPAPAGTRPHCTCRSHRKPFCLRAFFLNFQQTSSHPYNSYMMTG